jgi:hypothetical protein
MIHELRPLNNWAFDPRWFNKHRSGKFLATIAEDSILVVDEVKFRFENQQTAPPPGTQVQVWLTRWFVCETENDRLKREAAYKARQAEEAEKERIRCNQRRDQAIAINAGIKLPVQWVSGIKDVLSGLSANSLGDGRKRNTVQHIYLLESLHSGRIKRKAHDFLCTSASGANGKQWSDYVREYCYDGEGKEYQAPITCKKCLELAERLSSNHSPVGKSTMII